MHPEPSSGSSTIKLNVDPGHVESGLESGGHGLPGGLQPLAVDARCAVAAKNPKTQYLEKTDLAISTYNMTNQSPVVAPVAAWVRCSNTSSFNSRTAGSLLLLNV